MVTLNMFHPLAFAKDALIAKVNGQEIHQSEVDAALSSIDPQLSQLPEDQQKLAVISSIIDIKLLAQQAKDKGLNKTPEYETRMNYLSERELHNELFRKEILEKVTPEEVKARYEKEADNLAKEKKEEVRARHILVTSKDEAKAIIKSLLSGKKFEELAKEKSIDTSNKDKGGDLGYFAQGTMDPEFEKAAFALKQEGDITNEPVQTPYGWHVIRLENRRPLSIPPMKQVESQLNQLIIRDKYIAFLDKLKKSSKIAILDEKLNKEYQNLNKKILTKSAN
ncbi:peptidylprolyl isomerase [Liberibacter crescens]|nr:peptidylprolyl isomerase [Liberibacter crescens]